MTTPPLPEDARQRLATALRPRMTRYMPHVPTPKQHVGLILPQAEVLYGGAAGGGKSDWLLDGALQYVDVPGYSALLMRRTFTELKLEGGLLERAWTWLAGTDAVPHEGGLMWTFGDHDAGRSAVLQFGYLEGPHDHLRYQSTNWQYIGLDELTHFRERQYRYMFSRLRRPDVNDETPAWRRELIERLSRVPLRMRAGSNPGGPGHEWVQRRFGIYTPDDELREWEARNGSGGDRPRRLCHRPWWVRQNNRAFVPALLDDNPHIDRDAYRTMLAQADPVTRRQLEHGDWDVRDPGEMFRREWFDIVDRVPAGPLERVRYWDLAATEPSTRTPDPDWSVGLLLARVPFGPWYVENVVRVRRRSDAVERIAKATAAIDGPGVPVWLEQEPGASGKSLVLHWQTIVLPDHEVRGHPPSDSKGVRARPVASKAEAGLVKLVRGAWNTAFLDELEAFPVTAGEGHDDQVDALSGAFVQLSLGPDRTVAQVAYRDAIAEQVARDGELVLRGDRYVDQP